MDLLTYLIIDFKLFILIMIIICIHKKDALQIMADNKQRPNLRMPVESYKKYIYLEIN